MTSKLRRHHDWPVGRLARWKRRAISIPAILIGAVLMWALSPILVITALITDLIEGWKRRRWIRVLGFVMGFVTVEFVIVFFGLALWVATGFCHYVDKPWSQRIHHWVKMFWAGWVLRLIRVCMSTKVHFEGDEVVTPGPIITMSRHISMGDAVLPVMVLGKRNGLLMQYTLKDDLVWVPSLDVFGHRLPTHFIDRRPADRERELDPIRRLACLIDENSSGVVFPEGTFRTDERFNRAIEKIGEANPDRAERVGKLQHLLPIRGGGILAMFAGAPTADLVVIAHVGFDRFRSFKEFLENIPFDRDIEIIVRRISRSEVPADPDDQLRWLDAQWQLVDEWVHDKLAATGRR